MKRALIDWDFASHGIWIVNLPPGEVSGQSKVGHGREEGAPADRVQNTRPWSELLTTSLLDRLQIWNDRGCSLSRRPADNQRDERDWDSFFREGRALAETTQMELGEHWQVLWAAYGAWHFVRLPELTP